MIPFHNFQEFTLFLYLHVAHADGTLQAAEETVVRDKMQGLFEVGTDPESKFQELLTYYRSCRKEDLPVIIRDTFHHFSAVRFATKYKVYTDLFDIINADGKVEASEAETIRQLRDLMESHSQQPAE